MDMKEKLVELISESLQRHIGKSCNLAENIADDLIADGVTVQDGKDNNVPTKWISVKDRFPNYFDHVLINAPGDKPFTTVHEAHFRKDGLWDTGLYRYDKEDVTHWMPMPEPPKGE